LIRRAAIFLTLMIFPHGLGAASGMMTKWADPTAKIDALGRREDYSYGEHRVMSGIADVYGTVTSFDVDSLGRRKSKDVLQDGSVLLQRERYDYNNLRFKAFQTATTSIAYACLPGHSLQSASLESFPSSHLLCPLAVHRRRLLTAEDITAFSLRWANLRAS
jgi:hypothetical protein